MKTFVLIFLVLCGISCNRSSHTLSNNSKVVEPVVIQANGAELFQYWDLEMDAVDYKLTNARGLENYKDSLLQILGKEKLNDILKMESSNSGAIRKQRSGLEQGEIDNYQLSHAGRVGEIRPINHLEYEILNYQASRYPLLNHPTEFHAFILANDKLKKWRVCFAGGDKPWPPRPSPIFDHMDKVLGGDWVLSTHLHNHFEPDTAGYVGLLAPSMSDAQYFRMLRDDFNIPNTLITNGFHTVVLDSDYFDQFKVHE